MALLVHRSTTQTVVAVLTGNNHVNITWISREYHATRSGDVHVIVVLNDCWLSLQKMDITVDDEQGGSFRLSEILKF